MEKVTKRELAQTLREICEMTANPCTKSGVHDFETALRLIDRVWLKSFDILNKIEEGVNSVCSGSK